MMAALGQKQLPFFGRVLHDAVSHPVIAEMLNMSVPWLRYARSERTVRAHTRPDMLSYLHDEAKRTVYRFPSQPTVSEQKHRGKLAGWKVWMQVDITRADNHLQANGRWEHATFEIPDQHFEASRYSREEAIRWFLTNHEPEGKSIAEDEYSRLKAAYEAQAKCGQRP